MFKKILLLTAASAALLAVPGSKAQALPNAVVPGDTFNFDIEGFNFNTTTGTINALFYLSSAAQGYYTATFGTTTTFTAAGFDGQNYTMTSSETIGATTTTDTFTLSTPTNFINDSTITDSGTGTAYTINGLFFDIGTETGGTNEVSTLLPISTYTTTGSLIYGTNNTTVSRTPTTTLGTGNTSYSAYEVATVGTGAITTLGVHSFTYAITYANVAPEPSQYAAFGLGLLGLGGLALKARRRNVA